MDNMNLPVPPAECALDMVDDDQPLPNGAGGVDLGRLRNAIREILLAVGEDPGPRRAGPRNARPRRARMYAEVFSVGLHQDPTHPPQEAVWLLRSMTRWS